MGIKFLIIFIQIIYFLQNITNNHIIAESVDWVSEVAGQEIARV